MKNETEHEINCPEFNSDDISKPQFSKRAFVISLFLLGFPFLFFVKTRHCYDCGIDFKKQSKNQD